MDAKTESKGYIQQLKSVYVRERPKKLLEIAMKEYDLENGSISIPGGVTVPASRFCIELNYNMERILSANECPSDPNERRASIWAGISNAEDSYQISALLLTMERMNRTGWSFGSYIQMLLDRCGFKLQRPEWSALMAQARTYSNAPFDSYTFNLMWHNPLAVALYAAETETSCGSLYSTKLSEKDLPQELLAMFESAVRSQPKDLIESMMDTFIPACIGPDKESQLIGFKKYLVSRGFYTGPATADRYANFESGLAIHTVDVLYKLIDLARPQTPKEMGLLVLLAICHELSEIGAFHKVYRTEEVEGPAMVNQKGNAVVDEKHTFKWPDQRPYHIETKVKWIRKDPLPFDPGMKSLYITLFYFCNGILPEEVSSAIANYRRDYTTNQLCDYQLIQNTMCRYLHIADYLAAMLGERVV